jgi:hypothetical protein
LGAGLERPAGVDRAADLLGGDDGVEGPAVGRAEVHVLDEAQDVAAVAECSAIGRMAWSLTWRLTTVLTFGEKAPSSLGHRSALRGACAAHQRKYQKDDQYC